MMYPSRVNRGGPHMKRLPLAVLLLVLLGPFMITHTSLGTITTSNLEIVSQSVLGYCSTVASFGDVTYAGFGSAIVALDTHDPTNPRIIGRVFVPNCFDGKMSRSGNTLFVPRDVYGLGVFDISEPLYPSYRCTYARLDPSLDPNDIHNNHYAGSGEVAGGYLYWANGNYEGKGFSIFEPNPSEPDCLTLIGEYKVPPSDPSISFPYSVHVQGNVAYLCSRSTGVKVFDVTDKRNPTLQLTIPTGWAIDMTTSSDGRWGYVADGPSGLKIIDFTTNQVISYTPPAPGCGCGGGSATVFYRSIILRGNYVYVAGAQRGIDIIDVSTPTSPNLAHTIESESTYSYPVQLSVSGTYLYAANLLGGLKVYSLSNPAYPQLVRTVGESDLARDVAVLNGYAYIAYGTQGLAVVDVENPLSPSAEARFDINNGTTETQAVYALSNPDRIYVADGKEGLKVFQPSSNPLTYPPIHLWTFSSPVDVRDVHVVEHPDTTRTAYLADYDHANGGLWVLDVTGAGQLGFSPIPEQHLSGIGYACRLYNHGDWTYVVSNGPIGNTSYNGLRLVDSSGIVRQWLSEGYYKDTADVDAVDIGDRHYVLVATNGGPSLIPGVVPPPPSHLHILTNTGGALSEILSPIEFQGNYFADYMAAIEAVGTKAYINHLNNGVYVYDLSPLGYPTPALPQQLAFKKLTCNNSSHEIHLFGDYIYNAHGDSGLYILSFAP